MLRSLLPMLPLVALAGCGSGGGGGSTLNQQSQARVGSVTVTPDPDGTEISFRLISPDENAQSVTIEVSEDRGHSYRIATLRAGSTEELAATAGGTFHQVEWDPRADLTVLDQGDLRIRVLPRDSVTGQPGASATSDVFTLGSNTPPVVHSVVTPSGAAGGDVVIEYTISDAQADTVALELEFSLDGGASWQPATPGTVGEGATTVTTDVQPVARTVSWFAPIDAPNMVSNSARVRLRPVDTLPGNTLATGDFILNSLAPRITLLTVGEIPDTMNGSEAYTSETGDLVDFFLQVPPHGFELRVDFAPATGGFAVDPATVSVVADAALGDLPAGTELGGHFEGSGDGVVWRVPDSQALPNGAVTLIATVRDTVGNVSTPVTLDLEVVPATNAARPFEVVDRWWLNFESDLFTVSASGVATITVTSATGANGVPDFEEDLRILGLQSSDPLATSVALGTNTIARDLVRQEILDRLEELYGGDFGATGEELFSPQLRFQLEPGGHRSSIRVGGDDVAPGFTLGRAHFDHRNATGNQNQSTSLGVFLTNLIEFYINSSLVFQQRFDPLIPGRGTPVGEHPLDATVLAPGFERLDLGNSAAENDRYDDIFVAVDTLGRAVSVIIAHEVGHSLGLCSNGPPPQGLFGGVRGPSWSGGYTNAFHFDSPGQNLMAAALSFHASVLSGTDGYRFNEVNQAYLREMILLDN